MVRALRIVAVQVRASTLLGLQYRMDFVVDALLEVVSTLTALLPLWVVFAHREQVAGVGFAEALVVAGTFTVLQGFVEALLMPSLGAVIEHVRTGTLDFVLLLPADAQLLVSTSRFQPWRLVNVITGGVLLGVGIHRHGAHVGPGQVALALFLFACGMAILYAIVLLAVTVSFFAVKVDNLAYLVTSVLDAGRWPAQVFRGALRFVFTFVFPLAVMTTFPVQALLARIDARSVVTAVLLAAAFVTASRWIFRFALRRYASASS